MLELWERVSSCGHLFSQSVPDYDLPPQTGRHVDAECDIDAPADPSGSGRAPAACALAELGAPHSQLPRSVLVTPQSSSHSAKEAPVVPIEELHLHASEADAWVRVHNKVYDVTEFSDVHTGGRQVLLMAGRHESDAHAHSRAAHENLDRYCIGRLPEAGLDTSGPPPEAAPAVREFQVDPSKPLVFQVGHLGPRYNAWVHQPIVSRTHPRFFQSDILEFFSVTPWQAIPAVWLPVVAMLQRVAHRAGLALPTHVAGLAGGLLLWTLLEYSLHRFLFHQKTSGYWSNTLHFLLHGVHHKHPLDSYRLVFPPALTLIFVALFWPLFYALLPFALCCAAFGGALLGYVGYDLTHYYLHHGKSTWALPRQLKRNHMKHHFKFTESGFGITSTLWDHVFGSQLPK